MANIMTMTKEDFDKVPLRNRWDSDEGFFDSLVIITEDSLHDSGFRCLSFVGCRKEEPVVRTFGGSDVLLMGGFDSLISNKKDLWEVDCLPCGYLRLFCNGKRIKLGLDVSSFDVIAEEKDW